MPVSRHALTAVVATLVVLALVASATLAAGVGAVAADGSSDASAGNSTSHGAEFGNYTVFLPSKTDHYPRDENPGGTHNASIHHYAGGTIEAYDDLGIPHGFENVSFIWIENQDIDFSECTTENTAAFGIDRDSDDPGTETNIDLLQYRENTQFNKHEIIVNFFEGDEIAAEANSESEGDDGKESEPGTQGEGRGDGDDNAEIYPDDQVIAVQGEGSAGGPCYAMPEEPGWYQIQGYTNGTGWNGKFVELHLPSHYFYVCVCDSEAEARDELGPPPSEQDTTTPTPTPTATPTPTETGETPTPTETGETPTPTATPTPTEAELTPTATATPTEAELTPTPTETEERQQTPGGEGAPGFGVVGALAALLAAGLLAVRRAG